MTEKLRKKLERLDRKYEKAKGSIEKERIMKSYLSTEKKLKELEGK